jgi:N-acetylglutamate synthase-like GNAT family acetyltransferase
MIRAYRASFADMGAVTELDWRTQEFAMGQERIKEHFMGSTKAVYTAKVSTKHIGFVALNFDQFDVNNPEAKPHPVVKLRAVGTHPAFRKNGVARKIIERIDIECRNSDILFDKMRLAVPDYQIEDQTDPWNIEEWLWKMGFKAVKTSFGPHPYGDRDWYIMERAIGCAKSTDQQSSE